MTTPDHLFRAGHDNTTIGNFISAWASGTIEWMKMLNECVREMEKQRIELQSQLTTKPPAHYDFSMVPSFTGQETQLTRQKVLIESICLYALVNRQLISQLVNEKAHSEVVPLSVRTDLQADG